MAPNTPTPEEAAPLPLPSVGGAYVRNPDGTLTRLDDESTALPAPAHLTPAQPEAAAGDAA